MAVCASADLIREMENDIRKMIGELEEISAGIERGIKGQSGWSDSQSRRYHEVMHQIARLASAPCGELSDVLPRMEKLATALDNYNSVRF